MRLSALLAALCLLSPLAARERDLLVRAWQSEDGLPGNVVRSVVQAPDAYLWVATAEGVARFDGIEFEAVEPDGPQRGSRFAFRRIHATGGNEIWVSTFQGGLFRIRQGRFERVVPDTREPRPPLVSQVLEDASGTVFFKRGEEIHRIEGSSSSPVPQPDAALLALFEAEGKRLREGGRSLDPEASPILTDRGGQRWSLDEAGHVVTGPPGSDPVPVLLPGSDLPFTANEMLEDREGNIWIASPLNGLIRVRRSRVDVLDREDGLADNAVFAVMQAKDDAWWLANRSGGLSRWTPERTEQVELMPGGYHRSIGTLFEDRSGTLWAASRDGSVFARREGAFHNEFSKTQTPSKVRAIAETPDGSLWFGGSQGLASYEGGIVRLHGQESGLPEMDVSVLAAAPGQGLVLGTIDGRVFRGGAGGFVPLGEPGDLQHRWISALHPAGEREVWAATLGSGLFLWDGKRWHRFGADQGLPDERLTSLVRDGRGHFWAGSLGGIIRASRKELLQHAADPEAAVHWLRLDRSDGLPSRECIGGYQPAAWQGQDGRLWFPTGSGIVRVRPELVEINRVAPPVYLNSVRVNGQPHEAGSDLETGPGRSRLEFRFTGLGYSAPEKITYRARFSGLDDAWRELGTRRSAAYESVPPGRYHFEVMAVNGDGIPSEAPAAVRIYIRPHFWETGWFVALAALSILAAAAGTGWLLARSRMKRRIEKLNIRNAREGERARIARDLHDDLGASLTEISILAALAAEDATGSPLHSPLDQLSSKATNVVGTLDEIVWAVNPREDTLRSLVEYIAAFAREFLDLARIPLRADVTREIPDRPLGAPQRHGIFLAAREALNNIVKHAGAAEVKLRIGIDSGVLEIRIEDNGSGFNPEYARGEGLGNLDRRMREAGGECRIETFPGRGTSVILTFPLPALPAKP